MRFVLSKLGLFMLLFSVAAAAQVNPATNVRWPKPSCDTPGAPYIPKDNVCSTSTTTGGLPTNNPQYTGALQGPLAILNVMNASVNSQINVMSPPYNAKGDCTTDDHDAIIAAQVTALTYAVGNSLPAALYFPKPPGGCYLTSAIQWAGESLIGQPASGGNIPYTYGVTIKGKPGQDILYTPDPVTTAFTWYPSASIHDLTFIADSSTQVPHAHRWPGRWFDDSAMTSGSAAITTLRGEISCGDIGQAIQVNGAGASGGNLVTTIASVDPCWANLNSTTGTWQTITLAANASTTVTNAHTYISLLGLPVTETLNNCAMAFDMQDQDTTHWANPTNQIYGLGALDMKNVTFGSTGAVGHSFYTCGFYAAGLWAPYKADVANINVTGQRFGIVQTLPELNSYMSSGGDYQEWKHIFFFIDTYPWVSVDGGGNDLDHVQLATLAGPQILNLGTASGDIVAGWRIAGSGFEVYDTSTPYGWRIEGSGHDVRGINLSGPGNTGQFNANVSTCYGCIGNFSNTGFGNSFDLGPGSITGTFQNKGRGSKLLGQYNGSGAYSGMPVPYEQAYFPMKGDGFNFISRVTGDNLADGNYGNFYNKSDLFFWPEEFTPTPGSIPYTTFFNYDTASLSGASATFPASFYVISFSTVAYNSGTNSTSVVIGNQLPAAPAQISYSVKCAGGVSSYSFAVLAGGTAVGTDTQTCTTSYVTHHFAVDFTGQTGQTFGFRNLGANSLTIAWAAVRPNVADINGKTIPGAGPAIATGPTTSVLHNCPWFTDTIGTIGDSGAGCGGLSGQTPGTLYSAAGTPIPTCASGLKGKQAIVIDATSPTYMGAYASGGAITAVVLCSYNGTTYSWLTH